MSKFTISLTEDVNNSPLLQEDNLAELSENLNNPNKSRVRGPSGRKLPSRKKTDNDDDDAVETKHVSPLNDSFKNKLSKCLAQKKQSKPDPEPDKKHEAEADLNHIGTLSQAEFNKVWFFRVPTTSDLVSDVIDDTNDTIDDGDKTENNNVIKSSSSDNEGSKEKRTESEASDATEDNDDEEAEVNKKVKKKIWKSCQIL